MREYLQKLKAEKLPPVTFRKLQPAVRAVRHSTAETREYAKLAIEEDSSREGFVLF